MSNEMNEQHTPLSAAERVRLRTLDGPRPVDVVELSRSVQPLAIRAVHEIERLCGLLARVLAQGYRAEELDVGPNFQDPEDQAEYEELRAEILVEMSRGA